MELKKTPEISKNSRQNEKNKEIPIERYISPEKRQCSK